MLINLRPQQAALTIFSVALATLMGAWLFEYFGYEPCELCLKQRWAYYLGIPLSLALWRLDPATAGLTRLGWLLLMIIWLGSMIFGIYHSGVEWKWWPGPSTCSDLGGLSGGLPDLNKTVVLCDTPAIRILGLSLAGWNAVISAILALLAFAGLRRQGSSSVSQ